MHPVAAENARRDAGKSAGKFSWDVLDQGNDARLRFGKHAGKTVSELVETDEGKEYLAWAYRVGPEGLRNIIEGYFAE